MARALRLAELGCRTTHPNPRVGCVIVKDGETVGEGYHERAGGPHAEVVALRQAGARAKGAEVYVTLEPCCHHGRTPPCTDALIAAGIGRVVAAMQDPNPKVAGQGAARLRAAGIEVEVGLMEAEARRLNRGFVSRMARGRPFVVLKLAMSMDGRTALASGESKWITSEDARADVHRLRAEAGAVLTGVNTVLADDPELTVRLPPERLAQAPQPARIVLDTRLRTPAHARVWAEGARRILLTVSPRADQMELLEARGVEVALVGVDRQGRVALDSALSALGRMEINEALVECGPKLAGAFLQAGLVDELLLYVAPTLLGHDARGLAELAGITALDRRVRLRFTDVRQIGADLRITAQPEAQ
ncbi:MAG: bifunctional diaminohydroxyphosphoribosylaminopyrimidine deaminase/5-amino-6-(5-phosphoribosylamino)uracil reductase RibD [Gammaproteobacteria bacterium]|nr:bifunctional diaminohydroxyphosphoribosylaminopyrimidine deaminase/5-amino-6-(5-phosphoribosylamino)uracil reductase RibD [Gammaproteobacteria bacterium]